ncbi:MAG: helix-hairpin-helix domain-containing protein [wastewater metagenome]|nr:helix-hairpin-helix domain-containing protein [Candidatus Loosdrechtia aerotolerans]
MQMPQKPPSKCTPAKRQLIIIFFLVTMLFIGTIIKVGMDYHWWLPKTEIMSYLKPEEIKVKLDINKTPWYELILLPKLGETKAKAIVAYREKHGDFKTIDELTKVTGIGTAIVETVKDYVKIESSKGNVWIENHNQY